MTRLANIEKAGYFPTPLQIIELIANHITAPHSGRILDPCAGDGTAIATLAKLTNLAPYGNELDHDRAAQLRTTLPPGQAIHSDYRLLKIDANSFNAIYLNPPYLIVETENDSQKTERAEYEWLVGTRPYLQPNGLLVWVIPYHMLMHKKAASYLLMWYHNIRICRFPDDEYRRFNQIIIFALRNTNRHITDPDEIPNLQLKADQLPPLDTFAPIYTLPKALHQQITFTSRFINTTDALADVTTHGIATSAEFRNHLHPTIITQTLKPLTALKIGHINSIIAAGHLNNELLQNNKESPILIKGRAFKAITQTTATSIDDHEKKITVTRTEHPVTQLTTLNEYGEIQTPKADEFLTAWLPQLTERITTNYTPRYNFDLGSYKTILDTLNQGRIIPGTSMRGLLPAQAHAAAAIATQLNTTNNAILVGEMGTGKTVTSIAIAAAINAKRTIVLCPPHLVEKWIQEVRITWPLATAVALDNITSIDKFFAHTGIIFGIIKETAARTATGWQHAFDFHGPARLAPRTSKDEWELTTAYKTTPRTYRDLKNRISSNRSYRQREIKCPICGHPVRNANGQTITPAHFQQQQHQCIKCRSPLYQQIRDIHGNAKIALATYIKNRYKRQIDLLIADECHQFKAADSDRGYAFHRLVVAAKKTVGLTGTIYGGKASSLFHLLYRLTPEMKRTYKHNDTAKWIDRYGIIQEETTSPIDRDGKLTGNSRSKTRIREMPGGAPSMMPWLLNRSVFMSLTDLGFPLPNYQEISIPIAPTLQQEHMYASLQEQLKEELRLRLIKNDRSLLGAYLQALLTWPDSSWRPKTVRDPQKQETLAYAAKHNIEMPDNYDLIAHIPGLPNYPHPFPKETSIIELIQNELATGRKCLLLCQQTATLDITQHWSQMLSRAGNNIRPAILNVEPSKRIAWINNQVTQGSTNVIITHPKRIETGLDLLDFPTIIWMGTEYSIYTTLQASRRSWRIGQTQPVKVYFFYYSNTLQEDAFHLIAAKSAAAQHINGDTLSENTIAELDNSDLLTTLARIATGQQERAPINSLQNAFAHVNGHKEPEPTKEILIPNGTAPMKSRLIFGINKATPSLNKKQQQTPATQLSLFG